MKVLQYTVLVFQRGRPRAQIRAAVDRFVCCCLHYLVADERGRNTALLDLASLARGDTHDYLAEIADALRNRCRRSLALGSDNGSISSN